MLVMDFGIPLVQRAVSNVIGCFMRSSQSALHRDERPEREERLGSGGHAPGPCDETNRGVCDQDPSPQQGQQELQRRYPPGQLQVE